MAERIDELQLLIGSDASRAIEQLGALAGALDTAASSTRKLAGATGFLSSFSVGLSRIANTNLDRAISGLERLSKLDLSNLKNKTISIDLQVNGADRADRLKYATEQAAKSILKDSDQIAKSLGREYKMDTSSVSEMQEMIKEYIKTVQSGGDSGAAMDELANHIAASSRKSSAEILNTTRDMKAFLDYVNNMHVSPDNISGDAKQFWTSMGLERQLKKGAYGIDSWWQESSFQDVARGIIKDFDLFTNPEDQFYALGLAVMDCRERMQSFVQDEDTMNKVNASLAASLGNVGEQLEEGISKRMAQSKNAIPLDLDIDQARFESKIQSAITQATENKTYKAQPIKFDLDVRQLRRNIEQTIAEVDFDKLPGFAENFAKMSDSISQMNQVNLKDTGLTQFTNTLRRLVSTDTSKFDVSALNGIAAAIKDMAAVGNIDKGLNSFVSAISRLANAGEKTGISADGLKKLIPELKAAVTTFGALGAIDGTITTFIASLSKLASAGEKTNKTADGLKNLSDAVMEFLDALSGAPEINANIAATIQGLGNLAAAGSAAGKTMNNVLNGGGTGGKSFANMAVSTAIGTTTTAFRGLLSISLKLGSQGASALGRFLGKLNLLPTHANSIDRTALSFTNLLRAVIPFYGIRGLFEWGKEALEAGSSIVELENVIDTSFGSLKKGYEDISGYVYKWAESTIDAFGVSQIAAERYAGRLMAMFNSSGFDITEGMRDSAAQMSVDLIERAGDIASFYDITVDEAMTKMQSGLAGMTRPLRSLGINMSVANMEAFALSQGITTAWKSMDQASQMALRYQYILNATQYAAGDFQKTSMSLANQLRLLRLNFQMLSATIGQGLVSAIAPVISWLNLLIKRLIQAATAFRTFMWTLFGKPLQAARGTADDMAGYLDDASGAAGDLSDGAGGASDGLGKAGKAAKDLKKQLQVLPFDELNQLAKDTAAASSGGSGGGGGAGGLGGLGSFADIGLGSLGNFDLGGNDTLDKINKWAKAIRKAFTQHDWQGLGKNIADFMNFGFRKLWDLLDWKNVGPKVYGFIQPFQATINSMMHYINWDLLGRTFSQGLNTVTYTLRAWINGFNWRQWGGQIARGLNGMLDAWDADAFGRLLADKFRAAWNFFGGFVSKFNFKNFGKKLKEMVNGAITELNWSDMGETLAEFFNGVNDAIIEFFEDGSVVDNLSKAFSDFVNSFLDKFDAEKAKKAMKTVKDSLLEGLSDAISKIDKEQLKSDLITLLSGLPWSTIADAVGAVAGVSLAAKIFGKAFELKAISMLTGMNLGGIATGSASGAGTAAAAAGKGAATGAGTNALGVIGGVAVLIGAMKKLEELSDKWAKSKGVTETATDKVKGTKTFVDDYDADVVSGAPTTKIDTGVNPAGAQPQESIFTMILKGKKDPSFTNLETAKASLIATPIVKKIMDGTLTKAFKSGWEKFTDTGAYQAIKKFGASISETFQKWWTRYTDVHPYKAVKSFGASVSEALKTWYSNYTNTKAYNVTKNFFAYVSDLFKEWWPKYKDTTNVSSTHTFNARDGGNFKNLTDTWKNLHDKTIDLTVNLVKKVEDLGAWIGGKWQDLIDFVWNAKGGLFNGPMAFQVFGEAGAEAAIPLERKSTMRKIASAIVDSGGMSVGGTYNAGLAREIAQAVAPYIMEAVNGVNSRPVQVNATLVTENDEVLARAVTRGQKSIDKRYNPVSQFAY